uniref:Uncharacterized protein n=1 Tax=Moniliophthora roreri TaxID=221103 RepID=A0A0W0GCF9_MONRR
MSFGSKYSDQID